MKDHAFGKGKIFIVLHVVSLFAVHALNESINNALEGSLKKNTDVLKVL